MSVTDEIKERLDIVDLIQSSGVQLRKAGRNHTGFCPFHPNARTPAFYVFPHTQSYYCFSCHKAGDAFTFVMERQGLSFGDALEQLAQRTGVQLPERDAGMREAQEQENALHAKLRQINEDAAVYWNHLLRNTSRGEIGRAYVARRGLQDATVETWQLGYAPEEWSDLLSYLTDRKGHSAEELEQAGLVIRREQGGFYDRFRNRLMFPIRDAKGNIVGFGGRALGDDHAKYMNTPETAIFHKSSLLFGLHQARDAIRSEDRIVMVEGYLDVITAHQAGFSNVVAPMGTALTTEQVRVIRKLTPNIYLALDADAAGMRAAEKGVASILETSGKQLVQLGPFTQEWEADLDLPLRIIEMPAGSDPDDIIKANPDQWRELVAGAMPIVDFLFLSRTRGLDMHNPEHQQQALTALAPIVASIRDFAKRGVYESRLADLLRMPFGFIQASVLSITRQVRQRSPVGGAPRPQRPLAPTITLDPYAHEDELLSLLMRFPRSRERVETTLVDALEEFVDLRDDIPTEIGAIFRRTENRLLWQAWVEQGPEGPDDAATWLEEIDLALRPQADRLLQWVDKPPLRPVALLADARERAHGIAQRLRVSIAERRKNEMKEMTQYVEDEQDRDQLADKLQRVIDYSNILKAPRRSTIFQDLGSRREEFGS
jgi:DNA primase